LDKIEFPGLKKPIKIYTIDIDLDEIVVDESENKQSLKQKKI